MKSTYEVKQDAYTRVTNLILDQLETGVAPWRNPIRSRQELGLPKNFVSKRPYSGTNLFLLYFFGGPIPYYLTFHQVQELGGRIRKGAHGNLVIYYRDFEEEQADDATASRAAVIRHYHVFNVADVEGIEVDLPNLPALLPHERIDRCEELINLLPHPPHFTETDPTGAWYDPQTDTVNVPKIGYFDSAETFYHVYFHELAHSTGHVTRLSRETLLKAEFVFQKNRLNYSQEELTAELCAAYLSALVGIQQRPEIENSAAYCAGWLKALKNDKRLFFRAAAQAQKAADYLLQVPARHRVYFPAE